MDYYEFVCPFVWEECKIIGDSNGIFPAYSVLMSVYEKEKSEYLKQSVDSVFAQTVLPDELVLVSDGPLNASLYDCVRNLCDKYGKINFVKLDENIGLAGALNYGLGFCKNEIVLRMDSDDVAFTERAQCQLSLMEKSGADVVSSAVCEFEGSTENVTCVRNLPITDAEIKVFLKKRNPFNHPAVAYKKSAVIKAGGYMDYPFFEDYELFARMLKNGSGANFERPLVYMRASDGMYDRRGGAKYVKYLVKLSKRLNSLGIVSKPQMLKMIAVRAAVSLVPSGFRKKLYKKFLRK